MSYGNSKDSRAAGCGASFLLGVVAVVLIAAGLLAWVGSR